MKDKIITFSFFIFILSFSILHVIMPDKEVSETERRKLSTFPAFKLDNTYINSVEKYLLDQFPYRDNFRSIKAIFNYDVLQKLDNNKIYLKDNYIFKSNYPTNKKSIDNFIKNTNYLKSLLTKNNNVYVMLIPDKNYYLDDKNFLQIDYDYIYDNVKGISDNFIDLRNTLNLNDYYETDTHWKQENLEKVVKLMSEKMNFNYIDSIYEKHEYNKFYGVYYGESAIKRKPEKLTYLTDESIINAKVFYLENDKLNEVYSKEKLDSLDAYEVFLDGASAFIEIENNDALTNKELVIFRDSFGSSITPLLIKYYKKITLIDNRYIDSKNFLQYINFNNQDVLFLCSTLIVNSSETLRS